MAASCSNCGGNSASLSRLMSEGECLYPTVFNWSYSHMPPTLSQQRVEQWKFWNQFHELVAYWLYFGCASEGKTQKKKTTMFLGGHKTDQFKSVRSVYLMYVHNRKWAYPGT